MTSANRYVIKRFLLKAGLLLFIGLAHGRLALAPACAILFGTAAIIDCGVALATRTRPQRFRLTFWDEAAIFALLSLLALAAAIR
jgi:hypothetical protein